MYDIANALRRRAMAERLEDLQRARSAIREAATDRTPRPRHASEPTTGRAPAGDPAPTATTPPPAAVGAPSLTDDLAAAGDPDARDDLASGSTAATIADLLRGGESAMFFGREPGRP